MAKENTKATSTDIAKGTSNTPYDDSFRTMLEECPRLLIPVINEMFGTSYSEDTTVFLTKNEQVNAVNHTKRITDANVVLLDKKCRYHLECQTVYDGSMIQRMLTYDDDIANHNIEYLNSNKSNACRIRHKSGIIYLKKDSRIDKTLTVTDIEDGVPGKTHRIEVLRIWDYTAEELVQKKLYFLFPFSFFFFEKKNGKVKTEKQPLSVFADSLKVLYNAIRKSNLTDWEKGITTEVMHVVAENYLKNDPELLEEVAKMGGTAYMTKTRMAYDEGVSYGMREGRLEERRTAITKIYRSILSTGKTPKDAITTLREYEFTEEEINNALLNQKW